MTVPLTFHLKLTPYIYTSCLTNEHNIFTEASYVIFIVTKNLMIGLVDWKWKYRFKQVEQDQRLQYYQSLPMPIQLK